jgi:hypothetical protein
MQEQLDLFCEQNSIYSFEGERGVENLSTIIEALGYVPDRFSNHGDVLKEFLADNSGAVEAIYAWLCDANVPEWRVRVEALTRSAE